MRFTPIVALAISAFCTNANPVSTHSAAPSQASTASTIHQAPKAGNHRYPVRNDKTLGPIAVEVAPNGIVVPRPVGLESRHTSNVEGFSQTQPLSDKPAIDNGISSTPPLHLGHGPAVEHSRPITSSGRTSLTPSAKPIYSKLTGGPLLVPSPRHLNSRGLQHVSSRDLNGSSRRGISSEIRQCFNQLRPLQRLTESLLYTQKTKEQTLRYGCYFESVNTTFYDGTYIELMRKICWELYKSISTERRRRFRRCIYKTAENHLSYTSTEEDTYKVFEHEVGKITYYAHLIAPESAKDLVAELPQLSSEDIKKLNLTEYIGKFKGIPNPGAATSASATPNEKPGSRLTKRSWFTDLMKSIFSSELDNAISNLGQDVETKVAKEAHERHGMENHDPFPMSDSKREGKSNPVYVHSRLSPITPSNPVDQVDPDRDTSKVLLTVEDVDLYLDFIRDQKNLGFREYYDLRKTVVKELNLSHQFLNLFDDMESYENMIAKAYRTARKSAEANNLHVPRSISIETRSPSGLNTTSPAHVEPEASLNTEILPGVEPSNVDAAGEPITDPLSFGPKGVSPRDIPPFDPNSFDFNNQTEKCKAAVMLATSKADVIYLLHEMDLKPSECPEMEDVIRDPFNPNKTLSDFDQQKLNLNHHMGYCNEHFDICPSWRAPYCERLSHPHSNVKRSTNRGLRRSFKYPYHWDVPASLAEDPAYIALRHAWVKLDSQTKAWIGLEMRSIWLLRVYDVCKISLSWTKDLSLESQEIELKFKGLTLKKCAKVRPVADDFINPRMDLYWRRLRQAEADGQEGCLEVDEC